MASHEPTVDEVSAAFDKAAIRIVGLYQEEDAWKIISDGAPDFLGMLGRGQRMIQAADISRRGLSEQDALSVTPAVVALDMGSQPMPRAVWTIQMIRSALLVMFSGWRPEIPPSMPTWARPYARPMQLGNLPADAPKSGDVHDVMATCVGIGKDKAKVKAYNEMHTALKDFIQRALPSITLTDATGQ